MLMDPMDDCKISHLEVHCSGQILSEVDLLTAIEFKTPLVTSLCNFIPLHPPHTHGAHACH